jgi:hypothetical protein
VNIYVQAFSGEEKLMVVSLQHGYPGEAADRSLTVVPGTISKEPTDYGDQINSTESDDRGQTYGKACRQKASSQ